MKFLVDAQLPPALCLWLADKSYEAIHVSDVGLIGAADTEIADFASDGDWIVISKDDDFLLLRLPDRFSFIWLRCGNATNRALRAWLDARWAEAIALLRAGERLIEVR